MYWLALVLSIAGSPDLQMEMKMGSYFTCSLAKQKFEDANLIKMYQSSVDKREINLVLVH